MRTAAISIGVMLAALGAAPVAAERWSEMYRDAEGVVEADLDSLWTRGTERALTARIRFDKPAPGEVAKIVIRVEMDCATGKFWSNGATGYDLQGRQLYTHDYTENDLVREAAPEGPMSALMSNVCGRS